MTEEKYYADLREFSDCRSCEQTMIGIKDEDVRIVCQECGGVADYKFSAEARRLDLELEGKLPRKE